MDNLLFDNNNNQNISLKSEYEHKVKMTFLALD